MKVLLANTLPRSRACESDHRKPCTRQLLVSRMVGAHPDRRCQIRGVPAQNRESVYVNVSRGPLLGQLRRRLLRQHCQNLDRTTTPTQAYARSFLMVLPSRFVSRLSVLCFSAN